MDFGLNEKERAFEQEVKDFINENLTPDMIYDGGLHDTPQRRAFVSKMAEKGWLKMGLPEEYGGDGVDNPMAKFILNTELLKAGGPIVGKTLGQICGTLMMFGGEELKREFIAKTVRNEIQWAITYSEPGAGSDLASMTTRAVLDGDEFVINGEKRWITSAHFADYMWVAVRTDPTSQRHKGISILIVDRHAPGVSLQPITMIGSLGEASGVHQTNSVFFDNVRVPKSRLVGEMNKGWYYMMNALNFERFLMFGIANQWRHYDELLKWVKRQTLDGKPMIEDSLVRHKLAKLDVAMESSRMLDVRCICKAAAEQDSTPAVEAFMTKVQYGDAFFLLAETIMDLMGPDAAITQGDESWRGGLAAILLFQSGHLRIAASGVDVAKNMIAKMHPYLQLTAA